MRDFYKALGLKRGPDLHQRRIEDALRRLSLDDATQKAAEYVLLHPERRVVYDRHYRVLVQIGQMRANLGSTHTKAWIQCNCQDFDTRPWNVPSQFEQLKIRLAGAASPSREPAALSVIGWFWAIGITLIAGGIWLASQDSESTSSTRSKTNGVEAPPATIYEPSIHQGQVPQLRVEVPPTTTYTPPRPPTPRPQPAFAEPAQPLPATGVVRMFFSGDGVAPLKIVTQAIEGNYFIKIVDWNTKQKTATLFVRGGERAKMLLPLGSYELRYAAGQTWYGPRHYFGPDTSYHRADARFDFERTSQGYSGYTVELFLQPHGNLETEQIRPDEF